MCAHTLGHWYKYTVCACIAPSCPPQTCAGLGRLSRVHTYMHSDLSSPHPEPSGPVTHVYKHIALPTTSDTHICTLTHSYPLLQTQVCTKRLQQNTCSCTHIHTRTHTHTHLHAHPRAPTTCLPETPSAAERLGISPGNILRCSLFLELLPAGASPRFWLLKFS